MMSRLFAKRWTKAAVCCSIAVMLTLGGIYFVSAQVRIQVRIPRDTRPKTPSKTAGKILDDIIPTLGREEDWERSLRRRLRQVKLFLESDAKDKHVQVARTYQAILAEFEKYDSDKTDQDSFLPKQDEKVTLRSGVKGGIYEWFANMTPEARESFKLANGTKARQMLVAAIRDGDIAQLEKIYRLYFYTEAGRQAAYLLGNHHLDRGHPLRASHCFDRLKRSYNSAQFEPLLSLKLATSQYWAGMISEAQQTLIDLRKGNSRTRITVAGRDLPLFTDDSKALDWLSGVLCGLGPPTPMEPSQGGEPVAMDHRIHSADSSDHRGLISLRERQYAQRGVVALPAVLPLIVPNALIATGPPSKRKVKRGPAAIVRTLNSVVAIDLETGKRFWSAAWEPAPKSDFAMMATPNFPVNRFGQIAFPVDDDSLEQRLWQNATYGRLSTDGQRLFLLQRRSSVSAHDSNRGENRRQNAVATTNVLQARAVTRGEGNLLWEIGGRFEPKDSPFYGAYFLGPPLALDGALYVLADYSTDNQNSGEVRLLVLDSRAGEPGSRPKLLWRQKVAIYDNANVQQRGIPLGVFQRQAAPNHRSLIRRHAGLSPTFSDGLLICPTGLGAVVTINLTNRSLQWGYKYPVAPIAYATPTARMKSTPTGAVASDLGHWADASITVAGGRVLLTPPTAPELHCVNLADGEKLWTAPREDGLYLACVDEEKVVIVGSRKIRAFKLNPTGDKGESAWAKDIELNVGEVPSGRGFVSEGRYYLPLSTAKLAVIDLKQGKILQRFRSPEDQLLGNLICYENAIISQGAAFTYCYELRQPMQDRIRRQLAKNPADAEAFAEALRDQARILLHDGKLDEALGYLRRSRQAKPNGYTRELLVDSLLNALSDDFAKNSDLIEELGRLVEQDEDRAEYLRLKAKSLADDNKLLGSFDVLTQIVDLDLLKDPPGGTEIGSGLGRYHRVQTALAKAYRASETHRAEMDRRIANRLDLALVAESPQHLWRFLDVFADHPLAEKAQRELVGRAMTLEDQTPSVLPTPLETEWLLDRLEKSSDVSTVRWALAQRARLTAREKRYADATVLHRRLTDEYGDQVCLNGKTGKELFEELPADSEIRALTRRPVPVWGEKGVGESSKKSLTAQQKQLVPVPLEGDAAWVKRVSLYFNQQTNQLIVRDDLGKPKWDINLAHPGKRRQRDAWLNRAVAHGHLLVLYLGSEIIAIDAMPFQNEDQERPRKILWRKDLIDSLSSVTGGAQFDARFETTPWGATRRIATDKFTGRPLGRLGPVTGRYVCFQRGEEVVAVHPLTGRTLWTRAGVPPGSYLFGDDELVAIALADKSVGLVLRAVDGSEQSRPKFSTSSRVMASVGRKLAVWHDVDGKHVLRFIDAGAKNPRQEITAKFAAGSKAYVVANKAIAVLQPDGESDGEFSVFRVADGKREVDKQKLKMPGNFTQIRVMNWRDVYILAVSQADQTRRQIFTVYPGAIQDDPNNPAIHGLLYGFSRSSGKILWGQEKIVRVNYLSWALDQPSGLPVLIFTSGNRRVFRQSSKLEIRCLDKRTGMVVFSDAKRTRAPTLLKSVGYPEKGEISLTLRDGSITLRFSGQTPDKQ